MVGPLILMKLLHCKRLRHRKPCNGDNKHFHEPKVEVKIEHINEDYTCRVCLKEGNIPIFEEPPRDISRDLNLFAGIEVRMDDHFPKYLCSSCHSLLQGAILFRKTAQQTEESLKSTNSSLHLNYNNNISDNTHFDNNTSEDNDSDHNIDSNDSDYVERKIKKIRRMEPNYYCQRCNIGFDSFREYSEHKVSIEHETMKVKCPVCNKLYAESYLKKHLLLHNPGVPYVCDICGKNFIIQGQFTRHRMTHFYHLPFKCTLCPYRGRFAESLKMHMRSHTGDKPYQCSECAKCFISKSNLNKHMLTHKPDHDFKCESCGRGFNTKRELDLHFKVDHTGIKDHECNICGKAFGYRKQMMKHQLKVHKREKLRTGRLPLYIQVERKQRNGQDVFISDSVTLDKAE